MSKSYATDDWRATKVEETPVNYGLFAAPSPAPEKAPESPTEEITETGTAEVVGCICDETLTDSELPHNSGTSTTSQPSEEEENQAIDLNDLPSDPSALPKFPIWGLPQLLQDMITEGARAYGVPPEFFASYILSAIAAAVRKNVCHQDKYRNYPQPWCIVVAPSGIGKSEPLSIAFEPLLRKDKESYATYKQELEKWEAECAAVKSNNKKQKGEQQPEPPKPNYYQTLIQDTTPEALYQALSINNGLTLCRDELAGWFADFGRYNKSGEVGHYLSIFNNKQMKVNRKSEDPLMIDDPYLSIIGSIQPYILAECMSNRKMTESGFVQRFLFVFPDEVIKADPNDEVISPELLTGYDAFFNELFKIDTPLTPTMSSEAKAELMKFRAEMASRDRASDIDYLKSMYGKMEIHIVRLALIVYVAQLVSDSGEAEISGDMMKYCTELCRYFIASGEKVYRLISEPQSKPVISSNGDLIRLVDERYGIKNQTQFAESLGVSQQAISKHLKR